MTKILRSTQLVLLVSTLVFTGFSPVQADDERVDAATKKLMAAQGLYQRELFELAAGEYEEFLDKYGKHKLAPLANYGLGLCRYRLETYDQAVKLLAPLAGDKDFDHREPALAVLGHSYMQLDKPKEALECFDAILKHYKDGKYVELARLNRGQALYLLDRPKEAKEACEDFLKRYEESGRRDSAEYFLAISQAALGEHGPAAKTLVALLKTYKDSPYQLDARLQLGHCLVAMDKYQAARKEYQDFLENAPDDRKAEGKYFLGVAMHKEDKLDDAAKALREAMEKHGKGEYTRRARLRLGIVLLDRQEVDQARKLLERVAKDDEARRQPARYYLARCDMAEGKYEDARKTLTELSKVKLKAGNLDEVLYHRAVCAMALEQFGEAAKEFAEFRQLWPKAPEAPDAAYRQAYCLYRKGDYDLSRKLCRKLLETDLPESVERATRELLGENLFLLEQYQEAAKTFLPLASNAEGVRKLELILRIGQCYYYGGQYDKAIETLTPLAISKQAPKNPDLWEGALLLGDAQLKAGQNPQAVKSLELYLTAAKSKQNEARLKLALAQQRDDQISEAIDTLEELTAEDSNDSWVVRGKLQLGQIYYDKQKLDEAAKLLQGVIKADPEKSLAVPARYLLAWIEMEQGDFGKAADRFGGIAKDYPESNRSADAAFQQAVCLEKAGNSKDALKLLDGYTEKYPDSDHELEVPYLMAVCLTQVNRHKDAAKILEVLAKDKKARSGAVLYKLAWAYRSTDRKDRAVEVYGKLIDEFPKDSFAPHARAELAGLMYIDEQYKKAAELLEHVIADKSAASELLPVSLYRLGSCYEKLGNYRKASEVFGVFRKALTDHSLAPSALYRAGVAAVNAEQYKAAREYFQTVADKFKKDDLAAPAELKIGETYNEEGNYDKAAEAYAEFLKKRPDYKYKYLAQFGLGWAMENRKKYDEARKWYEKVVEDHDGQTAARARFQIGECYFAEGEYKRAATELLKVDIVYDYPKWGARALYEAGRAFEALKEYGKARKQYELCVKKYKGTTPAALSQKQLDAMD